MENVPGARRYKSIINALGLPLKVNAHLLGSTTRRETLLWTNAHPREFVHSHLTASMVTPTSVGDFLIAREFEKEWSAPVPLAQTVFPKFLSRIGSHASTERPHVEECYNIKTSGLSPTVTFEHWPWDSHVIISLLCHSLRRCAIDCLGLASTITSRLRLQTLFARLLHLQALGSQQAHRHHLLGPST